MSPECPRTPKADKSQTTTQITTTTPGVVLVRCDPTQGGTIVGTPADTAKNPITQAIASLGGATMDNEWNYVQCKLMRGLGVVFLENQARI